MRYNASAHRNPNSADATDVYHVSIMIQGYGDNLDRQRALLRPLANYVQAATAAASLAKPIPQAAPLQAKLEAFMVRMPPPGPQNV